MLIEDLLGPFETPMFQCTPDRDSGEAWRLLCSDTIGASDVTFVTFTAYSTLLINSFVRHFTIHRSSSSYISRSTDTFKLPSSRDAR